MKLVVCRGSQPPYERLGLIETLPSYGEQFTYDATYLGSADPQPISFSLPLQEGPYAARQMRPYFEGLLPEGSAREAIARELGVKATSYIRILSANGLECIGDIVLAPQGSDLDELKPRYEPIAQEELRKISLNTGAAVPKIEAQSRLSIAGAQYKTGLYHDPDAENDDGWFVPTGSAPSTHIVKFANPRFPDLIANEFLVLKTARACGLMAVDAFLPFPDTPMICIERFDRRFPDERSSDALRKRPIRLHQEDLCQAFGIRSDDKYEEYIWDGVGTIARFIIERSSSAANDLVSLVRWLLFNYVVGNGDNHLKNLSILYSEDWHSFSLSPFYDLVSTTAYKDLTRTVAMEIGKNTSFDKITREDFELLAEALGLAPRVVFGEGKAIVQVFEEALLTAAGELAHRGITGGDVLAEKILADAMPRLELLG